MPFPKPETCKTCIGWAWECPTVGEGFLHLRGTGEYGVLIVGEAPGEDESLTGYGFVGKAGETLDKLCKRGGMDLDKFWIYSVLACRPPKNKLVGQWYADEVIKHCAPNLDKVIYETKPKCIVTVGVSAFKRILPGVAGLKGVGLLDSKKSKGAIGYTFWSEQYNCWVVPTIHPSYILRGQTAWAQSLIFCLQRGVEIARDGFEYEVGEYVLDPTAAEAHKWVDEFEQAYAADPELFLSCDIETPEKDADEELLDLEDYNDYVILRCGYSFRDRAALSIPWDGNYRSVHIRFLTHPCNKCWWNGGYDQPRILSQGILIEGASHDGMDAWHILNSDLKKSLNFVTPWFRKNIRMWKHLSNDQPAFYNAVDADAAGSNLRRTIELLKKNGMYKVYQEFILELDPVFSAMTKAGMPVDKGKREESAKLLTEKRRAVLGKINELVPTTIRPLQPKEGYKKVPKDTTGLTQVVFNGVVCKFCSGCELSNPKKLHFRSKRGRFCDKCGARWSKSHVKAKKKVTNLCAGAGYVERELNPCVQHTAVERLVGDTRWAKVLQFVPSTKGVINYQKYYKHPFIYEGKGEDKKITTNEKALRKLIAKYPNHPFYGLVLEDRELTKLSGTYIGHWVDETVT